MKISNRVKKSLLILFLIIVISFISAGFVFGQRKLEIEYPEIRGFKPETVKTGLPEYVKYVFNFAIFFSGFIALGVLIYGGFRYFTSIGSPEKINDAKEWITGAIAGLLILFASYLVLSTINPELVILREPKLVPTIEELGVGVMACKEKVDAELAWKYAKQYKELPVDDVAGKKAIKDDLAPIMEKINKLCYYVTSSGDVFEGFDNEIRYAYFINVSTKEDSFNYGAIFYEDKSFKGDFELKNETRYGRWDQVVEVAINKVNVSSIRPFIYIRHPEGSAIIYEDIDFNFGLGTSEGKQLFTLFVGCFDAPFVPQSIEVKKDDVFVVLYKGGSSTKNSQVFTEPGDRDLNNNERISVRTKCKWYSVFYSCRESAVTGYCLEPAKFY